RVTMMRARSLGMTLVGVAIIGLAGCSASAGSTGVVQDDAVASPQATSSESSPGTDGGLGAAVPGASCADGGTCQVGDTGPGGGTVFYDAGSSQSWGQYLEAAPAGWSEQAQDPEVVWCAKDQPGYKIQLQTSTGSGSGRANTAAIIGVCGNQSAAGAAAAYTGGGLSDWFLPSKDELAQLWTQVHNQPGVVGGLATADTSMDRYWSSSQGSDSKVSVWYQVFFLENAALQAGGQQRQTNKNNEYLMRPIRAF
ncbi:MAG: hypothetical protein ACKOFX_10680, partial [Solirubrobacterales bacterium]